MAETRRPTADDLIAREYADPGQMWKYLRVGLWPSEEALVRRFLGAGSSVLDIGCGAGRTTIALRRMGYRVLGVDLMPNMVEAARAQAAAAGADVEFRVMNAVRLDLPDRSFDHALFLYNGYESIMRHADRQSALAEARRVIRPGGRFILAARSGLAFGIPWVGWAWSVLREPLKPLGLVNRAFGVGDRYRYGALAHYITPFYVFRGLRRQGFALEYYNSERNIDRGRRPGPLTHFSNSTSMFYVGRRID